ncbi:MAG: hypothetical protein ACXWB9_10450, partial [Flavisolibacter sp.]
FSAGKAKDPATQFTMSVQPASGVLQGLQQNGTKLSTALVTFTQKGEQGIIVIYTIRMEEIEISSCANVNDSNGNNTLVELRPARMGTTYYSFNRKSGVNTVSSKTGYDYINGKPWTKF